MQIIGEQNIADNPVKDVYQQSTKFRYPSSAPLHAPVDLADVELCGAEVLAREGESGEPILVRNKVGNGVAYLLCTYDFPGQFLSCSADGSLDQGIVGGGRLAGGTG